MVFPARWDHSPPPPSATRQNSRARNLPPIPCFITSIAKQSLVISILSLAQGEGFDNICLYGKIIHWFCVKYPALYTVGGILTRLNFVNKFYLRCTFKEAETETTRIYDTRKRRSDTSVA